MNDSREGSDDGRLKNGWMEPDGYQHGLNCQSRYMRQLLDFTRRMVFAKAKGHIANGKWKFHDCLVLLVVILTLGLPLA